MKQKRQKIWNQSSKFLHYEAGARRALYETDTNLRLCVAPDELWDSRLASQPSYYWFYSSVQQGYEIVLISLLLKGWKEKSTPNEVWSVSHPVVSDSLWLHGLYKGRLLCPWDFPRQEYWSGFSFSSPRDLPNPGTEPKSPALPANSLTSELSSLLSQLLMPSAY